MRSNVPSILLSLALATLFVGLCYGQCSGLSIVDTSGGSGTISEPLTISSASSYSNYMDCSWLIEANSAPVVVTFTFFETELNYDYVGVYDGNSTSSYQLAYLSGFYGETTYVSSGNALLVTFTSDGSVTAPGFSFNWVGGISQCDPYTWLPTNGSTKGIIETPYPYDGVATYDAGLGCAWVIAGPPGTVLSANIYFFDLDPDYDYLRIYDGDSNSSTPLLDATGEIVPAPVQGTGNRLYVEFSSGVNSGGGTGFMLQWFADTFVEQIDVCSGSTALSSTSGGVFETVTPYGEAEYTNNANCQWEITAPSNNYVIEVTFVSFATEANYDTVQVVASPTSYGYNIYSGYLMPFTVYGGYYSGSDSVAVLFSSDGSVTAQGFRAAYVMYEQDATVAQCAASTNLNPTANSGVISNPNPYLPGTNAYVNDANCAWTIHYDTGTISIDWLHFQTKLADVVTIYDGANANSEVLISWSGTEMPYPVSSSGGDVHITFTSDSSGRDFGFQLSYLNIAPQATRAFDETTTTLDPADMDAYLVAYGPLLYSIPQGKDHLYAMALEDPTNTFYQYNNNFGNASSLSAMPYAASVVAVEEGNYAGVYFYGGWSGPGFAPPSWEAPAPFVIYDGLYVLRYDRGEYYWELLGYTGAPLFRAGGAATYDRMYLFGGQASMIGSSSVAVKYINLDSCYGGGVCTLSAVNTGDSPQEPTERSATAAAWTPTYRGEHAHEFDVEVETYMSSYTTFSYSYEPELTTPVDFFFMAGGTSLVKLSSSQYFVGDLDDVWLLAVDRDRLNGTWFQQSEGGAFTPRFGHNLIIYGDILIAAGGYSSYNPDAYTLIDIDDGNYTSYWAWVAHDDVFRFGLETKQWTKLTLEVPSGDACYQHPAANISGCTINNNMDNVVGGSMIGHAYNGDYTLLAFSPFTGNSNFLHAIIRCPATYFLEDGECVQANPGYYAAAKDSLYEIPCPRGTYAGDYGLSACKDCSAGTFAANKGQDECDTCNAGTSSGVRAASCYNCPAGSYGEADGDACDTCSPGRYSAGAGWTSCLRCGANSYQSRSNSTSCETCPNSKRTFTLGQGSTSVSQCLCLGGFYGINGTCNPCPEGGTCPGGTTDPYAAGGYYPNPTNSSHFFQCFPDEACLGTYETGSWCNKKEGYEGFMCYRCDEGYMKVTDSCVTCNTAPFIIFVVLGVLVMFGILLAPFYHVTFVSFGHIIPALMILIEFCQVLGIFAHVRARWDPVLLSLFRVLDVLNANTDWATCVSGDPGYAFRFALQLNFPAITAAVFGVLALFVWAIVACTGMSARLHEHHAAAKAAANGSDDDDVDAPQGTTGAEMEMFTVDKDFDYGDDSSDNVTHTKRGGANLDDEESDYGCLCIPESFTVVFFQYLHGIFFMLNFLYLGLFTRVMEGFHCISNGETKFMAVNPDVACDSKEHDAYLAQSSTYLMVFGMGIPALYVFVFLMAYIRPRTFTFWWTQIDGKYLRIQSHFEAASFARKALIAVSIHATNVGEWSVVFVIFACLMFGLIAAQTMRPFYASPLDNLYAGTQAILVLLACIGYAMLAEAVENEPGRTLLNVTCMLMICSILVAFPVTVYLAHKEQDDIDELRARLRSLMKEWVRDQDMVDVETMAPKELDLMITALETVHHFHSEVAEGKHGANLKNLAMETRKAHDVRRLLRRATNSASVAVFDPTINLDDYVTEHSSEFDSFDDSEVEPMSGSVAEDGTVRLDSGEVIDPAFYHAVQEWDNERRPSFGGYGDYQGDKNLVAADDDQWADNPAAHAGVVEDKQI